MIAALLEYTPTQRLSAIEALCHPFFDELRDPNTKLPDSRHQNAPARDLPPLFNFTRHGMSNYSVSLLLDVSIANTPNRTFDIP